MLKIFKFFLIGILSFSYVYAKDFNKIEYYLKKNDINSAINLIDDLIKDNPFKFKNDYLESYKKINNTIITDFFKSGYNRYVELKMLKKFIKNSYAIDKDVKELAISYYFFTSTKLDTQKLLPFIRMFENNLIKNPKNNTKDNKEILALFYANYYLGINEDEKAYNLLKNNRPYHQTALMTLSSFSNIKNIPLFKDKNLLHKSINSEKLKLKNSEIQYLGLIFDFEGKLIK